MVCIVDNCSDEVYSRGLCASHYGKWRRGADLPALEPRSAGRPKIHGHGNNRNRTYRAWGQMLSRCYNEGNDNYSRYGAKGIRVCDRWRGELQPGAKYRSGGFAAFLEDMGECPGPTDQLHRTDPAGNYEPGNCVWITRAEHTRLHNLLRRQALLPVN